MIIISLKRTWLARSRLVDHCREIIDDRRDPIVPTLLPKKISPYSGIDRSVMNDIESARMRRSMRESAKRSADLLNEYFKRLRDGEDAMSIYVDMVER